MASFPDYYNVLNISKDASTEDIRQAYRKESLKLVIIRVMAGVSLTLTPGRTPTGTFMPRQRRGKPLRRNFRFGARFSVSRFMYADISIYFRPSQMHTMYSPTLNDAASTTN